jgi:hypothetical protein
MLYLTILSRRPTAEEVKTALAYGSPPSASKPAGAGKPGSARKPDAKGKPGAGNKPGATAKASAASKSALPGKPGPAVPAKRRNDWLDIAWALINSTEFLYRH